MTHAPDTVAEHNLQNQPSVYSTGNKLMTRVVMFDGGTLLGAGLASLLAEDETLQVESIAYVDMTTLLHTLADRQPDVIVLTEESPLDVTRLLDLLSVIQTKDWLRVMYIHHDDNTIDLYDKRKVTISHSQDVGKLIHGQVVVD